MIRLHLSKKKKNDPLAVPMHFLSITGSWWLIQIHLLLTFTQLVCYFP